MALSRRDPAARCISKCGVVVDERVTSKLPLPTDWPFRGWEFGLIEEDLHVLREEVLAGFEKGRNICTYWETFAGITDVGVDMGKWRALFHPQVEQVSIIHKCFGMVSRTREQMQTTYCGHPSRNAQEAECQP